MIVLLVVYIQWDTLPTSRMRQPVNDFIVDLHQYEFDKWLSMLKSDAATLAWCSHLINYFVMPRFGFVSNSSPRE